MNINPADNSILGPAGPVRQGQPNRPDKSAAPQSDSLDQTFKSHIEKALSISEPTDQIDLAQIRKELDAGLYDSPEMVRQAAQKMLKFGI